MWEALVPCSKQNADALAAMAAMPHITLSFCTNGLLINGEWVAYFLHREDLHAYTLPLKTRGQTPTGGACSPSQDARPISLSIMNGHAQRSLAVGPGGIHLVAVEERGRVMLTSVPLGETSARAITCEVDIVVTGSAQQPRPAFDTLYRALLYIADADARGKRKCELPAVLNAKIPAETLSISLTAAPTADRALLEGSEAPPKAKTKARGQGIPPGPPAQDGGMALVLKIAGAQFVGRWPGAEFGCAGTISGARIRELLKLAPGSPMIVGVIQDLGDFMPIWYARIPICGGRVIAVL
jgi:hypothetical protein